MSTKVPPGRLKPITTAVREQLPAQAEVATSASGQVLQKLMELQEQFRQGAAQPPAQTPYTQQIRNAALDLASSFYGLHQSGTSKGPVFEVNHRSGKGHGAKKLTLKGEMLAIQIGRLLGPGTAQQLGALAYAAISGVK